MITINEILETNKMISKENLDIRTITMGISLMDCITDSAEKTADNVYNKICRLAGNLVLAGEDIAKIYGIPIINKRVSVTPVSLIAAASKGHIQIARALDRAASDIGIDFLGGYTALVEKGMSKYEEEFIKSLPEVLATTNKLCSSVSIGSTKSGINMYAVRLLGNILKEMAERTREKDSFACTKFVAFCNPVADNPFMAGAFHGSGEGDCVINVGVSGPGVVKSAIENFDGTLDEVAERIKRMAFKITRVGGLVAKEASKRLNAICGIVDLSLAPTPMVGDSVAHILEEMGIGTVGGHGTTAALALLNDAVKKGGVMASSRVGGLSGAFIPLSEDIGMIEAAEKGILGLDKLEAMTAVCSVGLDMIAVPGDTTAETLSAIIADEAAIGMVNNKTTAVRIIPVAGKKAGEWVEFGGLLGRAPIIKVNSNDPTKFIARGGIIPAPLHSLKN